MEVSSSTSKWCVSYYSDTEATTFVQLETSDMLVPATTMTNQAQAALLPEPDPVVGRQCSGASCELPVAEVMSRDDAASEERFALALSSYCCDRAVECDRIVEAREAPEQQTSHSCCYSTCHHCCGEVDDTNVAISAIRPEYIYCKIIKPRPDAPLGISFLSHRVKKRRPNDRHNNTDTDLRCVVQTIARDGLLGDWSSHYMRPGDIVLSVNGSSTAGLDATQIAALLRDSHDTVSLTVHNPQGDPRTVASTVQKPTPDCRIGISLRSNLAGTKLKVGRVLPDSLFADSLLVAGHRCLEINGHDCQCMLAAGAADCLRQGGSLITILSRAPAAKREPRAVVLCREEAAPGKQKHHQAAVLSSWWKGRVLGANHKPQRAQLLTTTTSWIRQ